MICPHCNGACMFPSGLRRPTVSYSPSAAPAMRPTPGGRVLSVGTRAVAPRTRRGAAGAIRLSGANVLGAIVWNRSGWGGTLRCCVPKGRRIAHLISAA